VGVLNDRRHAELLAWLPREPERLEFVTPWGRVREMTNREVYELQREQHRHGSVSIRWATSWWLTRESFRWQDWCDGRDDAEWIASAYATVATAWAKDREDRERA
jgi:hypothetical protein